MKAITIRIQMRRKRSVDVVCPATAEQLRRLESSARGDRISAEFELLEQALKVHRMDEGNVAAFAVLKPLSARHASMESPGGEFSPPGRARQVAKCRSILRIANVALPKGVREEALEEWMDEIECAVEQDRRVLRRAVSILIRSVPLMALRSRMPVRARGGNG